MINIDHLTKHVDISDMDQFNAAVWVLADQMAGRPLDLSMMKLLSDNHLVGCHCSVCDWVDSEEHEQSILHPVSEPEYAY